MSDLVKDLKAKSDKAEAAMYKAQAAADKAREQHRKSVQKAREAAAAAQKQWLDAVVAAELAERSDGVQTAQRLVQEGGLSREAVKAAGIEIG